MLINTPGLCDKRYFAEFKKIITHFKTEKSFTHAQDQFIQAKQLTTQSVEEFYKSIQHFTTNYLASSGHAAKESAVEFLNTVKLSKFIEGLRPDISFELQ